MSILSVHRSKEMGRFLRTVVLSALVLQRAVLAQEAGSFQQFYSLSPEAAAKGAPVRIVGTVLCYDKGWNQLYVHDGEQVAWISPQQFQSELQAGWKVEIIGTTTWSQGGPQFTNLQARTLGTAPLPEARRLALPQLANGIGQWVQIEGRVRVAEISSGRLALIVQENGITCLVYAMGSIGAEDYRSLVGSRVRVRGINASKARGKHLESGSLTAPGREAVEVLEKGGELEVPLTSIDSMLSRQLGPWTNDPVRLSGAIYAYKPGEWLVLKDATGSIRARVIQTTAAREGERVELWGYLNAAAEEVFLRDACFALRQPQPAAISRMPATNVLENGQWETLTNTAAISRLPRERAALGLPVRLRGTVTYADPDWRICFLQDREGAIFVDLGQPEVTAGQAVEVTGQTGRGGFAPEVVNARIQVLGQAEFPAPVRASLPDLANGHLDSHWTELQGVVRRVSEEAGRVTLHFATPRGRFKATVLKRAGEPLPKLVDALASVSGAVTSEMNGRMQLVGVLLYAPGFAHVRVIEPATDDPFGIAPEQTVAVATFDPGRLAGRRVKVRGSVTMLLPDQGFYVQDEAGGIRIESAGEEKPRIGEVVEALGFPAIGSFSPSIEEAAWRRTGAEGRPAPLPVTAEEILAHGTNDGRLVQVEARLVQRIAHSARPRLLLQSGSTVFSATVAAHPEDDRLFDLRVGSELRVAGVCAVQANDRREPESFRLLLAGAEDVLLLRQPAWWTVQNTSIVLGSAGLAGLAVWLWTSSLRRQVRAQTEVIRRSEQELIAVSHQAGRAEVASSVLHNVGNVLNSVNVSLRLSAEIVRRSKVASVARAAAMLQKHSNRLGDFLENDPRGRGLPEYLAKLGECLAKEQSEVLGELGSLAQNVEHINDIVAMQQTYANAGSVLETVRSGELLEGALRMNASALERHGIRVGREYDPARTPEIAVERNKALQILASLLSNAKDACAGAGSADKRVTLAVGSGGGMVRFTCADNGVGIPPENLTRIFNPGFTTGKNGRSFELHSAAVAAAEMGGRLRVQSDGPGRGATFTLELPQHPDRADRAAS